MPNQKNELQWRETYFIYFPSDQRPTLTQVDAALSLMGPGCKIKNREANSDGYFESILVESADDNAALEISYETGDLVTEQSLELAKQMQEDVPGEQLQSLMVCDARLDLIHFEKVEAEPESEEEPDPWRDDDEEPFDEMLDPSCLLLAVDALTELTSGIAIDPASGSMLN